MIFKNFQEFLEKKEENQNGFSQLFLDKNNLTIEEAEASLINCQDCYNCLNCQDCIDCLDCENCKDCQDCQSCSNCQFCGNCVSLDKCLGLHGEENRIEEEEAV